LETGKAWKVMTTSVKGWGWEGGHDDDDSFFSQQELKRAQL